MTRAGDQALLLRADAHTAIGSGHVMRCLALAQLWRDRGARVAYASLKLDPLVRQRLLNEGLQVFDLVGEPGSAADVRQTSEAAAQLDAQWIVVDGYCFGSRYQAGLKNAGHRVLFVDDYAHASPYCSDLVLNQNMHACADMYGRREDYTRPLLGVRYALLRHEFRRHASWQRSIAPRAQRVLITMGGSDPKNVTQKVVRGLQQTELNNLEATVVVGASNPHLSELGRMTSSSSWIRIDQNVADMTRHMRWADLAVTAAGSTMWELAFLGLPSLSIIIADNQQGNAEHASQAGLTENLGWDQDVSPGAITAALLRICDATERRQEMCQRGRANVDGKGVERIREAMLEIAG